MSNLNRRSRRAAVCAASGLALFALGAAPGALAQDFKRGALEIIQPWSRATPGGAKVAAGYAVIRNGGAEPDRLLSASVEVAGDAMIHEMTKTGGVMTMRMLADGLVIPAHDEIALKPGSYHLMLEDLKHPLKEGETFKGSLAFEKAGTIDVVFVVEALGAAAPAQEGRESRESDK